MRTGEGYFLTFQLVMFLWASTENFLSGRLGASPPLRRVAALFFDAHKLIRENKLGSAWTHKRLVNVKFTKEQSEKPTIMRCLANLSKTCPH